MAVIGGFQSDLSITHKTDGNFGNVSAGVLLLTKTVLKIDVTNNNNNNNNLMKVTPNTQFLGQVCRAAL